MIYLSQTAESAETTDADSFRVKNIVDFYLR